jgi:hypothetical protein
MSRYVLTDDLTTYDEIDHPSKHPLYEVTILDDYLKSVTNCIPKRNLFIYTPKVSGRVCATAIKPHPLVSDWRYLINLQCQSYQQCNLDGRLERQGACYLHMQGYVQESDSLGDKWRNVGFTDPIHRNYLECGVKEIIGYLVRAEWQYEGGLYGPLCLD